ncbi:MAG: DUF4878 domain-containing protein [Paludibacteraceae bacterium]|nr:DUF4878 domain-containing protein [Paludibacteraceae bacterium]
MKKFFAFAILALFMVSCNTPSKVAEKFSVAIAHGKVDEAKKYCTENTAKILDFSSSLGGMSKIDPNYKIHILRDSVVDNIAYVFYTENDSPREHKMTLYKIDGEWKVNMDQKK